MDTPENLVPQNVLPKNIQPKWSRRGLIFAGLLVSTYAVARPVGARKPCVLFVCQYGTAKSAIARELFRREARERGVAVSAFSRGITIENHVSAQLRQTLAADGIDPNADAPTRLSDRDWRAADIVVAFNPLPPDVRPGDLRDWTDLPSVNEDYANARAMLDTRIAALLDEFADRNIDGDREAVAL